MVTEVYDMVAAVGFEPTPPKRLVLRSSVVTVATTTTTTADTK